MIIVILFFLVGTFLVSFLEEEEYLNTRRPDDLVSYLAPRWITSTKENDGIRYQIREFSMIDSDFVVPKPSDTFRIFNTGGSFAMGSPYVHQNKNENYFIGGMQDWVKAELEMRIPSFHFETINAAAGAMNSNRVRQIVEKLAPLKPDAFIVATGNNEGYVVRTRFNAALHQWSFYRLLKKTLKPGVPLHHRPMFAPQDPNTRKIEKQYQENITAVVKACKQYKVPLFICTLPINVKFMVPYPKSRGKYYPKASERYLSEGIALLNKGKTKAALKKLHKSKNLGEAAFYIALILEKQQNYKEAQEYYFIHVENMPKNRIRPSFNEFLRKTADEEGLYLVDIDRALRSHSPSGIASPGLFTDYCHLTLEGYYLAGQELLKVLLESKLIPIRTTDPLPAPTAEEIIDTYNWQQKYFSKLPESMPGWPQNR